MFNGYGFLVTRAPVPGFRYFLQYSPFDVRRSMFPRSPVLPFSAVYLFIFF